MTVLRITAGHFVAGIVPGEKAAPIVKYMQNWDMNKISTYCTLRGWKLEELQNETEIEDLLDHRYQVPR